MEHEITHAIFAIATGHRVNKLEAQQGKGFVNYTGPGNWLITISPYFFPAFCLALIVPFALVPSPVSWIGKLIVGAAFGLHVTSTINETHVAQTDLQKVGFGFAWAFLPTANLLAVGLVLGFAFQGSDGCLNFIGDVCHRFITIVRG